MIGKIFTVYAFITWISFIHCIHLSIPISDFSEGDSTQGVLLGVSGYLLEQVDTNAGNISQVLSFGESVTSYYQQSSTTDNNGTYYVNLVKKGSASLVAEHLAVDVQTNRVIANYTTRICSFLQLYTSNPVINLFSMFLPSQSHPRFGQFLCLGSDAFNNGTAQLIMYDQEATTVIANYPQNIRVTATTPAAYDEDSEMVYTILSSSDTQKSIYSVNVATGQSSAPVVTGSSTGQNVIYDMFWDSKSGNLYALTKVESSNTPFYISLLNPKNNQLTAQKTPLNFPATVAGASFNSVTRTYYVQFYETIPPLNTTLVMYNIDSQTYTTTQCEGSGLIDLNMVLYSSKYQQ